MLFDNVVELCNAKNITIAKLETDTGLGNATVRGWKTATPNLATLKKVADYFGVTIDYLMKDHVSKVV